MLTKPDWYYTQSAVIPYRRQDGEIRFLLITSRRRKRWVLPKGVCERGMSASASAAKEALEEAGVRGRVAAEPVGRYTYRKWGGICRVEVFTLLVEEVLERWPEQFRDREWLKPEEAASRVQEEDLGRLLVAVARGMR
jgi:phosphohistidine phosphatase